MTDETRLLDPALLLANGEALRGLARSLLHDAHLAEDVVQEAMLAAMRRPPAAGVPPGPWMVGVVRNLARMVRRGATRRTARETALPPRDAPPSPADVAARAEMHGRVADAVVGLAEPYRTAIVLRYFDGLEPAEIARRTGTPAATVRTHVHRGLALLRERLDGDHAGDRRAWAVLLLPLAGGIGRRTRRATPAAVVAASLLVVALVVAVSVPGGLRGLFGGGAPGDDGPGSGAGDVSQVGDLAGGDASAERGRGPRVRAAVPPPPGDKSAVERGAGATAGAAAAEDATTGCRLEVVDEDGTPVTRGTVDLGFANVLQLDVLGMEKFAKYAKHLGEHSLAAGNPLVVRDLPKELDGLEIKASARVEGLPPTEPAKFVLNADRIVEVRIVAKRAVAAEVRVVDRTTDRPVPGAAVVSLTEQERRGTKAAAVRGKTAPGSAVTGDDGACVVKELGGGTHDFEVTAEGYLRAEAEWSGGPLLIRLDPVAAGGTVRVHLAGPDGEPLEGVGVHLSTTDRVVRTDASGTADFDAVPPGAQGFSIDVDDWIALLRARRWTQKDAVFYAGVEVVSGGRHEAALGFVAAGDGVFSARVVDATGTPLAGLRVSLSASSRAEATTDTDGRVRFEKVRTADVTGAWIDVAPGADWYFSLRDAKDVSTAVHTWTLGAAELRGRVVGGPGRRFVGGLTVYASGPASGSADTDSDGRFTLPRAPAGKWSFEVHAEDGGARLGGVTVPPGADVVLELVRYGSLALRFAADDREILRRAKVRLVLAGAPAGTEGDEEDGWTPAPGTGEDDLVLARLLPGAYELRVSADGRTERRAVTVESERTTRVELRAP